MNKIKPSVKSHKKFLLVDLWLCVDYEFDKFLIILSFYFQILPNFKLKLRYKSFILFLLYTCSRQNISIFKFD